MVTAVVKDKFHHARSDEANRGLGLEWELEGAEVWLLPYRTKHMLEQERGDGNSNNEEEKLGDKEFAAVSFWATQTVTFLQRHVAKMVQYSKLARWGV